MEGHQLYLGVKSTNQKASLITIISTTKAYVISNELSPLINPISIFHGYQQKRS